MKKGEWLCSQCGKRGKEHFFLRILDSGQPWVVCSVCKMGFKIDGATDEEMKEMFAEEIKHG